MSQTLQGVAVARGIAIGRAVLVASSRRDVPHYLIQPAQVAHEIGRLLAARRAVVADMQRLQADMPRDMPPEVAAVLEVHLMLLQDEHLAEEVARWVRERLYNAEWALVSHLENVVRQFDEMQDDYLRERKADMEQVAERLLRHLRGAATAFAAPAAPADPAGAAHAAAAPGPAAQPQAQPQARPDIQPAAPQHTGQNTPPGPAAEAAAPIPAPDAASPAEAPEAAPRVLIAHDLSPADMLQFKRGMFAGFVTDVGGKTSHTAIMARSLDIPAVVGARSASHTVQQDAWVIIDGDAGVVITDPAPTVLAEYRFKQRQCSIERERLARLKNTPAVTLDGQRIELLANIEQPADTAAALEMGAVGVGLFRSEFLFMARSGQSIARLPDEEEQYAAYRQAVQGMHGMPVTIRTLDVGADKPLDARQASAHFNPALGLRAVRWSLSEPDTFLVQLRAILRAAAHGAVHILIPMLAHTGEIRQCHALIRKARAQLDARGLAHGPVKVGAMIEVPAAALMARHFAQHFDYLSVGTNDLVQYTLAVDRVDESVAHLYDPLHPAVLRLLAGVIAEGARQGKPVSVCGEMAGDAAMTRLLLGLGLRSFSMHPAQLLAVKQEVLNADTTSLAAWAQAVLASDEPAALLASAEDSPPAS